MYNDCFYMGVQILVNKNDAVSDFKMSIYNTFTRDNR